MKQIDTFEFDWCRSALDRLKDERQALAGTRWLIFGQRMDAFQAAVIRFLDFADRELELGLSVTVLAEEETLSAAAEAFPFARVESIDALRENTEADYCVYIGCTATRRAPAPSALEKARTFWRRAKAARRSLCVSGWSYGAYDRPLAAAEGEFRKGPVGPAEELARAVEALALENRADAVLLRPGLILAPGLGMENPVTALLDSLIRGERVCRFSPRTRYTLVYMSDLLTAFGMAAAAPGFAGAYNVGSPETTATLLRVCDLWDGEVPALEPEPSEPDQALSCGKLLSTGWKPEVDLQTMIALEVLARKGCRDPWITGGHDGKLEIIHAELLKILVEIDRICKKHNIRYFLAGGTLLGAVRHRGFIPWDDDLDIMMLREDHDRFLAVARQELPEQMFLQTPQTDPGCHYLISKVRLSGTVFSSEFLQRFPELHKGIFVDVIAQDYTADSAWGQRLHLKLSLLARGLVFKKWSGQSAASVKKGYAAFDAVKGLLPMAALERFQRWALTLFNKKPRRYLFDSMGINISRGAYPAAWLAEQTELTFEGRKFPGPAEYDGYLTYLYGDYMQPVPVSRRRVVHTVPQLDLGDCAAAGCVQNTERKLSSLR